MGESGVRVSRYFQRKSNGAAESAIKFVIEGIHGDRNSLVSDWPKVEIDHIISLGMNRSFNAEV
jgi:hypothetical protein